jgi:hypothetical protein
MSQSAISFRTLPRSEEAIRKSIDNEMESGKAKALAPTVRQILEYELVHNVHTHLPKLKDNTAAIGIVWMTRSLSSKRKFLPTSFKFQQRIELVLRLSVQPTRLHSTNIMDGQSSKFSTTPSMGLLMCRLCFE